MLRKLKVHLVFILTEWRLCSRFLILKSRPAFHEALISSHLLLLRKGPMKLIETYLTLNIKTF